jgi:hypothetical protein
MSKMSKFEEKYIKIGFGILDNNIFLLRINNKWYRFKEANREDKNSLFFEIPLEVFIFKKQYEKVKNGNKKGFGIYIRK